MLLSLNCSSSRQADMAALPSPFSERALSQRLATKVHVPAHL
jgi:hypothetical protein